jgi:nucleotide-binding universal stress UspA family protein
MNTFTTMLAIAPSPAQAEAVQSVATEMAEMTGARLLSACVPDEAIVEVALREAADVVVLEGRSADRPEGARRTARRCLDAGLSVIAVPALRHAEFQLGHIGLGHDLGPSTVDAQAVTRKLVASVGAAVDRVSIVYVDDSFAGGVEPDDEGLFSRRTALIEWGLQESVDDRLARVRPVRLVGDPSRELENLSHDLDLLVLGARSRRGPLGRLLSPSVSSHLLGRAHCPLLVVPVSAPARPTAAMPVRTLQRA